MRDSGGWVRAFACVAFVGGFGLTGCSSSATSGDSGESPDAAADATRSAPQCIPGMAIQCACTDGSTGAQSCNADGVFTVCVCATGRPDAGSTPDVGPPDVGAPDAGFVRDVGAPDVGMPDVGVPDVGMPDVGMPDVGVPDVGVPDAGFAPDVPGTICGPGTYLSDAGCVPVERGDGGLSYYDLRVSVDHITGDGLTVLPVLALGREADGSPSTRDVVFSLSRAGAGTITPSARLGAAGTTVNFVPCNAAASPACTGPVQVFMALASAPSVVVATSPVITVTDQVAVGTPAPCLGGGNVAYVIGDTGDYITGGRAYTYRDDLVTARLTSPSLIASQMGGSGINYFTLEFTSTHLGVPLAVGVYENAMRYPFEDTGHAGFSMSGMGRGCNELSARFQIHELTSDGSGLRSLTATFEQHCEGGTSAARGCIRWAR